MTKMNKNMLESSTKKALKFWEFWSRFWCPDQGQHLFRRSFLRTKTSLEDFLVIQMPVTAYFSSSYLSYKYIPYYRVSDDMFVYTLFTLIFKNKIYVFNHSEPASLKLCSKWNEENCQLISIFTPHNQCQYTCIRKEKKMTTMMMIIK